MVSYKRYQLSADWRPGHTVIMADRVMDRVMVNFVIRAFLLFIKFIIDAFFMEAIVMWLQSNVFLEEPEELEKSEEPEGGEGRV